MSQINASPPLSKKISQLSGASRSPSPSVSMVQRIQDSNNALLSSHIFPQLGANYSPTSSPSTVPGLGRSPSPAVGSSQLLNTSSPQSYEAPPPPKRRQLFHRELKYMMHGFGDDPNPYSETVELVEELVLQFVTEMTLKAMDVGKNGRVHVNDIIFIIRKDRKKYSRIHDLLMMKEQIDKAKKAFSEDSSEAPI